MSAVRRWTWPIVVPAAIGRSARAMGSTASLAHTDILPRCAATSSWTERSPTTAPGLRRCCSARASRPAAAQERARGRRRGAGGPAALARLAHVARADPGGARARERAALRAARGVLRALPRPAAQVLAAGCGAPGATDLAESEEAMLALTCERAQIEDGMDILDLGCGWGSLSLWLGEQYPNARVTGISNSAAQREHIEREATQRGITNVEIVTADANAYDPGRDVDRVLSVEMFEHMRNWKELLRRISHPPEAGARQGVRAGLQPPQPRLPLRGHLGRRALLHRRHDAEPRPDAALPGAPRRAGPLGRLRHPLRADAARVARAPGRQLGRGAGGARALTAAAARRAVNSPPGGCS